MLAFDVFQREPGGHYVWHSAAKTFDEAHATVKKLNPANEFMIVNEDTGERTVIKPNEPRVIGLPIS